MSEPATVGGSPFWMGPLDPALQPEACPGGCRLEGGMGSCDAMRTERRRWCPGYGAMVCQAAFDAWRAAGRPQLSQEALGSRARRLVEPLPAPPATPPELAPVLASAPATLDGWELYAPHAPNGRGGFHDLDQRQLKSAVAGWDQHWRGAKLAMPWLVLLGPPGTGKTLLLRILARHAAEAGLRVRWAVWSDLVDEVHSAYRQGWEDRGLEAIVDELCAADLVVLDDVRPVHTTQHDENLAHRIIARRYGEDRGEPCRLLFLSANLTPSELELVIGAAALSRLRGAGHIWPCAWPPHPNRGG